MTTSGAKVPGTQDTNPTGTKNRCTNVGPSCHLWGTQGWTGGPYANGDALHPPGNPKKCSNVNCAHSSLNCALDSSGNPVCNSASSGTEAQQQSACENPVAADIPFRAVLPGSISGNDNWYLSYSEIRECCVWKTYEQEFSECVPKYPDGKFIEDSTGQQYTFNRIGRSATDNQNFVTSSTCDPGGYKVYDGGIAGPSAPPDYGHYYGCAAGGLGGQSPNNCRPWHNNNYLKGPIGLGYFSSDWVWGGMIAMGNDGGHSGFVPCCTGAFNVHLSGPRCCSFDEMDPQSPQFQTECCMKDSGCP